MTKYHGALEYMDGPSPFGAAYPNSRVDRQADTPCPACSGVAVVVWRDGGAFQQRTECTCGRKTRWVMCGHDAQADTTDDLTRKEQSGDGG